MTNDDSARAESITLAEDYFRGVPSEDLRELEALDLAAVLERHRSLADSTANHRIDVHPNDATGSTSVQIVTADVPFVVDSVLNVLVGQGLRVGPVVHPVVRTERGAESWIHVEVAGAMTGEASMRLRDNLAVVIDEVQAVAAASDSLRRKLEDAIDLAASRDAEARDFLLWLRSGRFDLFGYRTADSDDSIGVTAGPLTLREADGVEVRTTRVRTYVRRQALLDRVLITLTNADGSAVTQCFDGLFTAAAAADPIESVPMANRKAAAISQAISAPPASHAGRAVDDVLQSLPRDEVLRAPLPYLLRIVEEVYRLSEQRAARSFVRIDHEERSARVLVFLPRDWYATDVRLSIQNVLRDALGDERIDFTARLGDKALAQVSFTATVEDPSGLTDERLRVLEQTISDVCTPWRRRLDARLRDHGLGPELADIFPEDYVAAHSVDDAVGDARFIAATSSARHFAVMSVSAGGPDGTRDLRLFSRNELALADLLPIVQSLGLIALDERAWSLQPGTMSGYIVQLRVRSALWPTGGDDLVIAALEQIGAGIVDADSLNRLVVSAAFSWQEVEVLRAYLRYLRQLSSTFTHAYMSELLTQNPAHARMLVGMFAARFQPGPVSDDERATAVKALDSDFQASLNDIQRADTDRILRELAALIDATLRTSAYSADGDFGLRPALALKFDTRRIPFAPAPRPTSEVWVHSPLVEGVHLRFAAIARGGLRWSDRLEDFRTEVLGLAKAQTVKNAVIVPAGAKGGFVVKSDRAAFSPDQWGAVGRDAYRIFVGALLDITDNIHREGASETVVRDPRLVIRDGDDPYLVVAADKGTANLSDVANELSLERGFWLGDAFASGGSNGYDHKALGITARGAWESVRRHFSEMGLDPDRDPITAVGIGDMSGDVFGNGMLLSRSLKLVAAFDHRHVFVDPAPEPTRAYDERRRLFELPRSSWDDYDRGLISAGGGVFERSAKVVPLTTEIRHALGLSDDVTELTPSGLISAVLRAPVDLLWNGGVGTYVKSSAQSHADAADRANDWVRVDARELRVRVIGEGGNLGLTQAARVEASRVGVRLNTDAIDNSAGVDCSDHEVNLKIALDGAVAAGQLTIADRQELLRDMATEVADLVIRDNFEQNVLLANERAKAAEMLPVHLRFMQWLEKERSLDRGLEGLPSDEELGDRASNGVGLMSPELAVIAALAKLAVKKDLEQASLVAERFGAATLARYFPAQVRELRGPRLIEHPLAESIVATSLANDIINIGGITFMFRVQEETGASVDQVIRAFVVAREVFAVDDLRTQIHEAGSALTADVQAQAHSEIRRLMDRATRWFLQRSAGVLDVEAARSEFVPSITPLLGRIASRLFGEERLAVAAEVDALVKAGASESLASRAASLLYEFRLLDIAAIARGSVTVDDALDAYMAVCNRYGVSGILQQIAALPRDGRWHPLARTSLRADLEEVVSGVAQRVIDMHAEDVETSVESWERGVARPIDRARKALEDVDGMDQTDFAAISVAIRLLREASHLEGEIAAVS
ncbi:NAD-glutamate dehydrogenase domain-containing protein [Microbacterium sp. K24]|uniref:NAD-glutamate dehydrogenase domain-containing protein n=1 Tax=Microbacterium sp. K24 TaxID=2305446 RepID=UPI00109D45E9|nr:NAD-glutamate dehydrogenase domain-containing protein [Microbacterium sp. K24]